MDSSSEARPFHIEPEARTSIGPAPRARAAIALVVASFVAGAIGGVLASGAADAEPALAATPEPVLAR